MAQTDRIAALERQVAELRAALGPLVARPANWGNSLQVRYAVTAPDPDEEADPPYPLVDSSPNTYWIRFVDLAHDDEIGNQELDQTERSEKAKVKACQLPGDDRAYLAEGTLVAVFHCNGRWWIDLRTQLLYGVLYDALDAGQDALFTVWAPNPDYDPESEDEADHAWAAATIRRETVWDWLLKDGATLPVGTRIVAGYSYEFQRWMLLQASCRPPEESE